MRTPKADPALCPTCVQFMVQTIDILVDILANGEVIGNCQDLCAYLPTQLEFTICELICSYVGIEIFIYVLQDDIGPDPIFYCEELDICPISTTAKGTIDKLTVTPKYGPVGTTFDIYMEFTILSPTGTGQLEVYVIPADNSGQAMGGIELLVQTPKGHYAADFPLQAEPSENEPFNPGVYNVTVALCEGMCASIHRWSYVMDEKMTFFYINATSIF